MTGLIQLSEKSQLIIDRCMSTGDFENVNDIIERGLSMLQSQQERAEKLADAIAEGESSGIADDFSFDAFRKRMSEKYDQ